MGKMNINKTTGELTSASTALLNQIRESKKKAQSYIQGLRAVEDKIRAKLEDEKREQDRLLQEQEDAARKEIEEATLAQAERKAAVVQETAESENTAEKGAAAPARPRAEKSAPAQPRNGDRRNAEGAQRGPRAAQQGAAGAPRGERRGADAAKGPRGQQSDRPPRSGQQPSRDRGGFAGGKDKDAPQTPQRRQQPARRERSEVLPMQEKERASAYDPNKKQYDRVARERDNTVSRAKNKKTLAREAAPAITLDDEFTRNRKARRKQASVAAPIERRVIESAVITSEKITIKELSEKIGKPSAQIIKTLFMIGMMVTINSEIDFDTASLVAAEYNITLEQKLAATAEETLVANFEEESSSAEGLMERPPVVTIMGHVDHGKTSLLDAIRNTRVTATEAGGITQAIGAYTIDVEDKSITFVDTPGHEAFTAMRARGAQVTDIAILVVAADDGVMPQTIEAINHIQAAKVPMIVAINKIDRPTANVDRVMQELTKYSVVAEDWGGDTVMVPVSALTGENLEKLLEMILLVAEVEELTADPSRRARGAVLEASLDRGRGAVATVLVQDGTLHVGDYIVAGTAAGRVRAMINDKGETVQEAGPSTPVEVMGFSDVPDAGDQLYAVEDERLSRKVAEERREKIKIEQMRAASRVTLDDLFSRISEGEMKELRLIIKADVHGSAEAIRQSMEKLSNEEVRVVCMHAGVGAITESDVNLAASSDAIIIGFNIRPDAMGRAAAERENVDVRTYRVIYDAIEEVKLAMKGLLAPQFKEVVLGHAEVRTIFTVSSVGTVAGSYITDGRMLRNASARLVRDGVVIYEGKMSSLRRFKDDVREVNSGYECGITLENYNDVKEGDVIEAFQMEEIAR